MNAPVEVTSYSELMAGIQAQLGTLGIRYLDFDVLAGFAPGLSGKVFGPAQVKRLGPEKMFDALRAAGLRLRIEVDPQQTEKMKTRIDEKFNPRNANQARMNNDASRISTALTARVFKHFSRQGNKARWANKSPKERSEHARMIANMRWKAKRKEQKKRARQRKAAHKARKG